MAYSKNARALNLFCAVSKNLEHFVTNFKNQCNFYKKQVHGFMFWVIVFLDYFLVQLVIKMCASHT